MLRYVLVRSGEIIAENVDIPVPSEEQVLVKVKACGICGTDIHAFQGKHPFITPPIVLGHEFSGIEVESGRRVVVEPSLVCGKCYNCRTGRYNICNELKVMGCQSDGAFAEYLAVPKTKIFQIPSDMSFEEATLVEPTAVALHAVKQAEVKRGDRVVVLGAGPIGLLTLQVSKVFGAKEVVSTDISTFRLNFAKQLGADYVVNVLRTNLSKWVHETFGADGIDKVFECVGGSQDSTINQAIEMARKGTRVTVVGVFQGKIPVNLSLVQDRELELVGSLMYVSDDFSTAIRLIHEKRVNAAKLISRVIPVEKIKEAFLIDYKKEEVIKIILRFGGQ